MLFEDGRYPVFQMLKHIEIDCMKDIGYDDNHRRDAFPIPQDAFCGSNRSIFQMLSRFRSIRLISLSRNYHFLEV